MKMKKLVGLVAALALTTLAGVSTEARTLKTICSAVAPCPARPNCQLLGCIKGSCQYYCRPFIDPNPIDEGGEG
jgi:hypothetical protein